MRVRISINNVGRRDGLEFGWGRSESRLPERREYLYSVSFLKVSKDDVLDKWRDVDLDT